MAKCSVLKNLPVLSREGSNRRLILDETVDIDDRTFFSIDLRQPPIVSFLSGDARSKSARAGLKALLANLKELRTKASQQHLHVAAADLGIQRPDAPAAESMKKKGN